MKSIQIFAMRKGNECDCTMKVLMLGNSGTGKSSLITRFVEGKFELTYYSSIGVDFRIKNIQIDDTKAKMQVWDTAGQDRFKTITANYYRGADGVVIVYDLSDSRSFKAVQEWLEELQKHIDESCQILLVGNKLDLSERREISKQEAAAYANKLKMVYMETSAREGTNVNEAYEKIGRMILNTRSGTRLPAKPEFKLKNESEKKQDRQDSGCC